MRASPQPIPAARGLSAGLIASAAVSALAASPFPNPPRYSGQRVSPTAFVFAGTVADFDGDGDVDIFEARRDPFNTTSSRLELLLNDGTGRFPEVRALGSPSSSSTRAAAGDWNGDGSPDVAYGTALYFNDGTGNLNLGAVFAANGEPIAVDFDQDGRDDVFDGNRLHFVGAPGAPTAVLAFPGSPFPSSRSGVPYGANDMTNDGRPDLLFLTAGAQGGFTISMIPSSPTRTPPPATTLATIENETGFPVSVAGADIDGDGDADLAALSTSRLFIFLNDGTGNFIRQPNAENLPATALALRDVNADGRADILLAIGDELLVGTNLPTFSIVNAARVSFADSPTRIWLAHLDSDTHVDAIGFDQSFNEAADFAVVAYGDPFGRLGTLTLPGTNFAGTLQVNRDPGTGTVRMASGNTSGGSGAVFTFRSDAQSLTSQTLMQARAPHLFDIDADTDFDIIGERIFINETDTFTDAGPSGFVAPSLATVTLQRQGQAPRIASAGLDRVIRIYDVVEGQISLVSATPSSELTSSGLLICADLNADGLDDAIISNRSLPRISTYLSNPDGTLTGPTTIDLGSNVASLHTADVTADGLVDILVLTGAGNVVFMNQGNGQLQALPSERVAVGNDIDVADVDNDGTPDLIVLDVRGTPGFPSFSAAYVHRGLGQGLFETVPSTQVGLPGTRFVTNGAAFDVDSDGDIDLICPREPFAIIFNTAPVPCPPHFNRGPPPPATSSTSSTSSPPSTRASTTTTTPPPPTSSTSSTSSPCSNPAARKPRGPALPAHIQTPSPVTPQPRAGACFFGPRPGRTRPGCGTARAPDAPRLVIPRHPARSPAPGGGSGRSLLGRRVRRPRTPTPPPAKYPPPMPGPLAPLMRALHGPVYRARLRALTAAITPHLRAGDEVLDVGCGAGTLGHALATHPNAPANLRVRGLESRPRGGEPIEVIPYTGGTIPLPDRSVDVVILADVLHHEPNPDHLAAECARISRRLVIIKDHQIQGILAQARVSFIDWAANAPYGVPCLYRYNTPAGWHAFRDRLGARAAEERHGMRVYPPVVETVFGGSLHYFGVLDVSGRPAEAGAA